MIPNSKSSLKGGCSTQIPNLVWGSSSRKDGGSLAPAPQRSMDWEPLIQLCWAVIRSYNTEPHAVTCLYDQTLSPSLVLGSGEAKGQA